MSQAPSWPASLLSFTLNFCNTTWTRIKDYTKETLEHFLVFSSLYCLLCVFLYVAVTKWRLIVYTREVKNRGRVLIVIAHPDDEVMFFGPTVLNLARDSPKDVYLLCLSSGKNYGMAKTRKYELYQSCKVLGIEQGNVMVVNNCHLPDDIRAHWPVDVVADIILDQVEMYNISTLVTFDRYGVSYHPNHCCLYLAVAHLALKKRLPPTCSVYVLESVNVLRKYALLLDVPITFLLSKTRYVVTCAERGVIHKAMKQHQSQLLWFRRLYMLFSRYMLVNSLQLMEMADFDLDLELED